MQYFDFYAIKAYMTHPLPMVGSSTTGQSVRVITLTCDPKPTFQEAYYPRPSPLPPLNKFSGQISQDGGPQTFQYAVPHLNGTRDAKY